MESATDKLLIPLHVKYIQSLDTRKDDLEYWLTEHLRLNGLYWGLTALDLMNNLDALPRQDVIDYVASLQHDNGGFGGDVHHDAHITHTLSAIQILITLDAIDSINVEKVVECKQKKHIIYIIHLLTFFSFYLDIKSLRNEDGSFKGDNWGEVDTRFCYIALSCLSLLKRLEDRKSVV